MRKVNSFLYMMQENTFDAALVRVSDKLKSEYPKSIFRVTLQSIEINTARTNAFKFTYIFDCNEIERYD